MSLENALIECPYRILTLKEVTYMEGYIFCFLKVVRTQEYIFQKHFTPKTSRYPKTKSQIDSKPCKFLMQSRMTFIQVTFVSLLSTLQIKANFL